MVTTMDLILITTKITTRDRPFAVGAGRGRGQALDTCCMLNKRSRKCIKDPTVAAPASVSVRGSRWPVRLRVLVGREGSSTHSTVHCGL